MRHAALAWILLLSGLVAPVAARDIILTVGGGPDPKGNQVSLEKNVQYLQRMLALRMPEVEEHAIFFSDGDDPGRDTQLIDPEQPVPRVNRLLAEVFRQTSGLDHRYRTHEVESVLGPATPKNVSKWFDEVAPTLGEGDRLFVYCTGHGGKNEDDPWNAHLWMWNRQKISVQEFAKELDMVPAEVPVVVIMVQCYSGSFANLIFREGKQDSGVVTAPRCGFFASTHDRPAAGCTPDVNEAAYEDYSSHFFAGLFGVTRTGDSVKLPDFDGDGSISLEEAHGYALIHGDSIDIPTTTLEAFLRAHSRSDGKQDGELTPTMPTEQLLDLASPTERAVLLALTERLGLDRDNLVASARQQAQQAEREKRNLERGRKGIERRRDDAAKAIRGALTAAYPELAQPWHPDRASLLAEQGDELVQRITGHRSYAQLEKALDELADLNRQRLEGTKRAAACQRVVRVAENIALAGNLSLVAEPEIQDRYYELRVMETRPLLPAETVSDKLAP